MLKSPSLGAFKLTEICMRKMHISLKRIEMFIIITPLVAYSAALPENVDILRVR